MQPPSPREAAAAASARGDLETAVRVLREVLDDPFHAKERPQLLMELAMAEAAIGDEGAIPRLAEAAGAQSDPEASLRAAMLRGHLLTFAGRWDDAFAAMRAAIDDHAASPEHTHRARLELAFAQLSWVTAGARARAEIASLVAPPGDEVGLAYLHGLHALADSTGGVPATAVAASARLAAAALPGGLDPGPLQAVAPLAMVHADAGDEALRWIGAARDQALRHDRRVYVQILGVWSAFLAAREGRPEAVATAHAEAAAFGPIDRVPTVAAVMLAAALATAAIDTGDLGGARAEADRPFDTDPETAGFAFVADLLVARSAVRRAEGNASAAIECARRARAQTTAWGATSPSTCGWGAELALGLLQAGERAEAEQVARTEVEASEEFGAPRPLARALRVRAEVSGSISDAERALTLVEGSRYPVEEARCLTALGRVLTPEQAARARETLRTAGRVAAAAGAHGVAAEARAALVAAGGRPRRTEVLGWAALTRAQQRTARLAAAGATNAEIARELSLTVSTVEQHLTRVYRTLGVEGRADLPSALEPEPPALEGQT